MSCPYSVLYNNTTGRVVIHKNKNNISPPRNKPCQREFDKKIEELYKFTNIDSPNKVSIERNNKEAGKIKTIDIDKIINEQKFIDNSQKDIDISKNYNNITQYDKDILNNNDEIYNKHILRNRKNYDEIYDNNRKNYDDEIYDNNSKNNNDEIYDNNEIHDYNSKNNNIKNYDEINNKETLNNNIKKDNYQRYDKNILKSINDDKNDDKNDNKNDDKNYDKKVITKSLIYGIKKTILSDFNHLYQSSNTNDFKIGLNKNILLNNNKIFDCFYLFPNISEINTKNETNIINEKKIEIFCNNLNPNDIQYFPIDFIACGSNIPLLSENKYYSKLKIKNIFWNIFQSINSSNYKLNEILCIVPNKDDYIYKNINLQVNFELHSQIISEELPYKNNNIKQITPANTCLYQIPNIQISNLNGSNFHFLEINLNSNLKLECALLCVKISVPCSHTYILEGMDKNNRLSYGNIPFSQFILNFEYELF